MVLPGWWLAYPVHPWKRLIPFSDPLTILIKRNLDDIVATIVHELCHVFFSYYKNNAVFSRPWRHIRRTFAQESVTTQLHRVVHPLTRAGRTHLFGEQKAERPFAPERKYEGLTRAWAIIDARPSPLPANPLDAVRALRNTGRSSR